MPLLNIGEVAAMAGVTAPTVRYYESIGLLRKAGRSAAGYRRYGEGTVRELDFIRKARALGFSLDEIGEIVTLTRSGKKPCARVVMMARKRLSEVEEHMQRLAAFRAQLSGELERWNETPTDSCDGECRLIASANPVSDAGIEQLPLTRRRRRS